jgi:Sulfotransferase family
MRFVLLHYHFLKNAGTTIENILDRNFGERFARLDTPERSGHYTNAALLEFLEKHPEVAAVSSHQIRHPLPEARGYLFFDLCFLRDPIDRIRSMYDYFREKPAAGDPLSELANRSVLGEFITCLVERFREEVTNVQVALLAHGGVDEHPPDQRDFAVALERALEMAFLGVVDQFDESLIAGRYFLDPVFPALDCSFTPANVSGGMKGSVAARRRNLPEACGRAVYRELVKLNALDCELLRRARAEVRRRLALVPQTGPGQNPRQTLFQRLPFPALRIRHARLFDPGFYLERYPDVRQAGIDPLRHYLRHGAAEGRKPHPLFQPDHYLARCPEARNSGNPLLHFLDSGAMCSPHPLFDSAAYVEEHPDAAAQPLSHYLRSRERQRAVARSFPTARLNILDVPVEVSFPEGAPANAAAGPVTVWKDADGRKQFLAPPEQKAFFRAAGYRQLRAQIDPRPRFGGGASDAAEAAVTQEQIFPAAPHDGVAKEGAEPKQKTGDVG